MHKVPLSEIDSFEEIPSGKICDQDYVRGISHLQSNIYDQQEPRHTHTYYTFTILRWNARHNKCECNLMFMIYQHYLLGKHFLSQNSNETLITKEYEKKYSNFVIIVVYRLIFQFEWLKNNCLFWSLCTNSICKKRMYYFKLINRICNYCSGFIMWYNYLSIFYIYTKIYKYTYMSNDNHQF